MIWSQPGSPRRICRNKGLSVNTLLGNVIQGLTGSTRQKEWSREGWKTNSRMSYETGHSSWRTVAGFFWGDRGAVWKPSQDCPSGRRMESIYPLALMLHRSKVCPQNVLPCISGLVSARAPHGSDKLLDKLWKLSRGVRDGHEARPCLLAPTGRHLLRACINDWNKDRGYPKARGGTQEVSNAHSWKFDIAFKAPSKTESLSLANGWSLSNDSYYS